MSYTLYFDGWGSIDEDYRNCSQEETADDTSAIIESDQFSYWFSENNNESIEEMVEDGRADEVEDQIESFKESDAYYEYEDTFVPIYNIVHVLQSDPYNDNVKNVNKFASSCAIIELTKLETYVIALLGCGMDMSDNIELAYYFMDGESPVEASQIMSLSKDAEQILLAFRKLFDATGRLSVNEIDSIIKEVTGEDNGNGTD